MKIYCLYDSNDKTRAKQIIVSPSVFYKILFWYHVQFHYCNNSSRERNAFNSVVSNGLLTFRLKTPQARFN